MPGVYLLRLYFVAVRGCARGGGGNQVGYVLGRMEAPPPVASGRAYYASDMSANSAAQSAAARQGHITSLAVLPEFRRLGLAAGLMEEVQKQMEVAHGGEAVSLHVRCSNAAALRLYGPNGLGYRVEQTIEVRTNTAPARCCC